MVMGGLLLFFYGWLILEYFAFHCAAVEELTSLYVVICYWNVYVSCFVSFINSSQLYITIFNIAYVFAMIIVLFL